MDSIDDYPDTVRGRDKTEAFREWEERRWLLWRNATLPPLTRDEEQEIIPRAQAGDEGARETVIRANLRFVISVAKTYTWSRVPMDDLISEGVMGLHRSILTFDLTRGLKFISYAVWWIRHAMMTSIQHSRVVYRPPNLYLRLREYEKKSKALHDQEGFVPTFEAVCDALGWRDVQRDTLQSYMSHDLSLEHTYNAYKDNDTGHPPPRLLDFLKVEDPEHDIEEETTLEALGQDVVLALRVLDSRAKYIIARYFGLQGDPPDTLENIGRSLGITRERVRQIKEKSLIELQRNKSLKIHFIEN